MPTLTARDGIETSQGLEFADRIGALWESGHRVGAVIAIARNSGRGSHHAIGLHVHAFVQGLAASEVEGLWQKIAPGSLPGSQHIEQAWTVEQGGVGGWLAYCVDAHEIEGSSLQLAGVYADRFAMQLAGICGECRGTYRRKRTKARRFCSRACRIRAERRLNP